MASTHLATDIPVSVPLKFNTCMFLPYKPFIYIYIFIYLFITLKRRNRSTKSWKFSCSLHLAIRLFSYNKKLLVLFVCYFQSFSKLFGLNVILAAWINSMLKIRVCGKIIRKYINWRTLEIITDNFTFTKEKTAHNILNLKKNHRSLF